MASLKTLVLSVLISTTSMVTIAIEPESTAPSDAQIHEFLSGVFNDNTAYVKELAQEKISDYQESQAPRATVLMCSDSRVQSEAFHRSPINDLFFIRNIGNQIKSTEGSVEYGVEHLNTPVLLIIGHSQCGAIKTALTDYSNESIAIRQELNNLHLTQDQDVDDGVIENIHEQVTFAVKKFAKRIEDKQLVVIGALYDFRDDYKHGHGKIILIDINGETNPQKLSQSPYIKGVEDMAIGENRANVTSPTKVSDPQTKN